jgi:hypothetical protein
MKWRFVKCMGIPILVFFCLSCVTLKDMNLLNITPDRTIEQYTVGRTLILKPGISYGKLNLTIVQVLADMGFNFSKVENPNHSFDILTSFKNGVIDLEAYKKGLVNKFSLYIYPDTGYRLVIEYCIAAGPKLATEYDKDCFCEIPEIKQQLDDLFGEIRTNLGRKIDFEKL